MKIIIVGTGYVGLVTGACLADVGIEVVCVDIDQQKINDLKQGKIPIYEPGLEKITHRNIKNGRLKFSTSLSEYLEGATAIFIAVGTPPDEHGEADLKYVDSVAREIGKQISDYVVVVTKSTVPVGTSERIQSIINQEISSRSKPIDFDVASNPEFLKEGAAIEDFMSPDRIVIGVESQRAKGILERIYRPFQLNGFRIIYMDVKSAELTKYAANCMLATRISFMNDIANLCERLGANVNDVRVGIGSDPRIGSKFLYPGIGYGGSCFPKDVKALVQMGKKMNYPMQVVEAVDLVNERQKSLMANKVIQYFEDQPGKKRIGLWGLSFKPNTDDMREAPSITICEELIQNDYEVIAYDPVAMQEAKKVIPSEVQLVDSAMKAVEHADALILTTEWNEFRSPNWKELKAMMKNPTIFDGRNIYEREYLEELGFKYFGIGQ